MANQDFTRTGQPSVGQSTTGVQEEAGLKEKAEDKLHDVADRAGSEIESRLETQKGKAAETLSDVADSLLMSSQHLREQQRDVGRYVERAADQVERLAQYLQRTDVDDLVDRVEGFARRQPAAFMGGAFAIGFIASRFLKSSQRSRRSTGLVPTDTYARDDSFAQPGGTTTPRTSTGYSTPSMGTTYPSRESGYAATGADSTPSGTTRERRPL